MERFIISFLFFFLFVNECKAWSGNRIPTTNAFPNSINLVDNRKGQQGQCYSRRDTLTATLAGVLSTMFGRIPPGFAASSAGTITETDKLRISKGYDEIRYLLDHFDEETTVCRENGGECKRDADAVRKALGLRSTTDVLFQIDKVFAKAKNMDIDPDKLDVLFEATEDWNSAISMSNSMAFISQFGEYNPGGGKDTVLKYLIESRKQVELAESALVKIMDSLDILRK